MKTTFQIFRRDCRRILRSPVALMVLMGVIVLPCLYAWVNIGAYEDPYQFTSGLKVAVACNDRGAVSELAGEVNAGARVVDSLRENDSLGWVFTDGEDAVQGVRSGDYYAAIVIPETFSEDLLSVTTGELRQPVLEYYVNEKKNAMAPLILNVGANTLKNQINQRFIDAAAESVTEIARSMLDELDLKLDEANGSLTAQLRQISDTLAQYEALAEELQTFLADHKDFDSQARSSLEDVSAAAKAGDRALKQADQTLTAGREVFLQFSEDLDRELSAGADGLSRVRRISDLDLYTLNARLQSVCRKVELATSRLQEVTAWNGSLIQSLETLQQRTSLSAAGDLLQKLEENNQKHSELLQALQTGNQALSDAADQTLEGAARIQSEISDGRGSLDGLRGDEAKALRSTLTEKLDGLSYALGQARGLLEPVDGQIAQMNAVLDSLERSLDAVNATLSDTSKVLTSVRAQIDSIILDLDLLANAEDYKELLSGAPDGNRLSGFLSSPVSLRTESFFPVRNYGTAMSPFFTNLVIWVGGIVLLSLFKLEVDTDEEIRNYRPVQGYVGRGILFLLAGQAQAITVCMGDLLLLKIQCVHPVLFVLAGMLASFVYVNLIYALGTTLKHIGKALCVIILIFQIPSSSGTYPMEMTPSFFRALHPFLPFTYGVDAMREALIGVYGHHYAADMLRLSSFVAVALVLGLALRPLFINLNILFDKKLAETDLMVCDEAPPERERFRLLAAIRLLAGRERYQERTEAYIRRFEAVYQKRVRQSFRIVLIVLPVLFLVLMFTVGGSKMLFLILWICSLIALMVFQIVVEFIREHLDRQRRMAEMTDQELLELLNRRHCTGKGGGSLEE